MDGLWYECMLNTIICVCKQCILYTQYMPTRSTYTFYCHKTSEKFKMNHPAFCNYYNGWIIKYKVQCSLYIRLFFVYHSKDF